MGSARLPGKVLLDLGGKPVLARVVERLRNSDRIDEIIVATTTASADDAIMHECARLQTPVFRGSEHDVLDRYLQAAKTHRADAVVRITSDCPLIDPDVVDKTIARFIEEEADFACNVLTRTYPRGLDTEVFSFRALEQVAGRAQRQYEREHVTPFFYEHADLFKIVSVAEYEDFSRHRWTLDTEEDLKLIREIYTYFGNHANFRWRDAAALMDRRPELAALNAHVLQKSMHSAQSAT